jgi:uncharacterized delta-60 repeat protein
MKKLYFYSIIYIISFNAFSQNWGLDQDFNTVGYNATNIIVNGDDNAKCLAIQNDGKILTAGIGLSIVRHNSNGTLDTSFNGIGYTLPYGNNTSLNEINQILIKPDNKILVIGTIYTSRHFLYLAQYNSNGSLDTTFGSGGRKNVDIGSVVYFSVENALLTTDDKILICSNSYVSNGNFALIRCNNTGSLDTTFGNTGIITVDGNDSDGTGKIIMRSDGKILLSGNSNSNPISGSFRQHVLMLFNQDGTFDTSFGNNGKVFTTFNVNNTQIIQSVILLDNNKIIIGGCIQESLSNQLDFFLSKFNSDGTIDTTFGDNGKSIIDFNEFHDSQSSNDFIFKLVFQNDGKIIATGYTSSVVTNENKFALARLTSSGVLDSTFGTNGKIVAPIYGFNDVIYDANIQNDGKIVVCGSTKINSLDRTYVAARFTPNSTLATPNIIDSDTQIQIYPNPVKDIITINSLAIQNWNDVSSISIYNVDGKELKKIKSADYKYDNNQLKIDMTNFNSGIYILKFINGTKEFVKKITKE